MSKIQLTGVSVILYTHGLFVKEKSMKSVVGTALIAMALTGCVAVPYYPAPAPAVGVYGYPPPAVYFNYRYYHR